jgi:hypothetical protein
MASIISCPSCARRLSVKQAATERLFKCPACNAVFARPADAGADEVSVPTGPPAVAAQSAFGGGAFSETPFQPTRAPDSDAIVGAANQPGDVSDDWPDFDRPLKKPSTRRRLLLALTGVAVLIVLVGVLLYLLDIGSEPLVGSWRGTFKFHQESVDCVYRFAADGRFLDEHFEPQLGVRARFPGRYKYAHGRVTIVWENGGFETASVRRTGLNTIEYVVLAHSDRRQIGCKVTFNRQR